jgi:hypothetical protein
MSRSPDEALAIARAGAVAASLRPADQWPGKSEAGVDPHKLCARFHVGQQVTLVGDTKLTMVIEALDVSDDALVHVVWRHNGDLLSRAIDPRCLAPAP